MNDDSVTVVGIKLATVWGAVGITSWSDLAAFLAALYSALLLGEWVWKHGIRRFCERRGWVKRRLRRAEDRNS